MSDVMLFGVLKMPYELAMSSELSRRQFYDRVQELVKRFDAEQPAPPPECKTDAEKTAFAFGWWKALEENRKQPAKQQAGHTFYDGNGNVVAHLDATAEITMDYSKPSAWAQRKPWVGLTEEEIDECYYWKDRQWTTDELVRHVEAKLREKNA